MPRSSLSSGHAFFLGIMALMVAVMCVTIRVIEENLEARIIMAVIWAILAIWWLVQAAKARPADSQAESQPDTGGQSK